MVEQATKANWDSGIEFKAAACHWSSGLPVEQWINYWSWWNFQLWANTKQRRVSDCKTVLLGWENGEVKPSTVLSLANPFLDFFSSLEPSSHCAGERRIIFLFKHRNSFNTCLMKGNYLFLYIAPSGERFHASSKSLRPWYFFKGFEVERWQPFSSSIWKNSRRHNVFLLLYHHAPFDNFCSAWLSLDCGKVT